MSQTDTITAANGNDLILSTRANLGRKLGAMIGQGILFSITALAAISILFIFYFIARDAIPFFTSRGFAEFFTRTDWYPSRVPGHFGALPIFVGSALVTLGAVLLANGAPGAVCRHAAEEEAEAAARSSGPV